MRYNIEFRREPAETPAASPMEDGFPTARRSGTDRPAPSPAVRPGHEFRGGRARTARTIGAGARGDSEKPGREARGPEGPGPSRLPEDRPR